MKRVPWFMLGLCLASTTVLAADTSQPMRAFEENGFTLTGAEYWPYVGDKEPEYPSEVLWGFYPEKGVTAEGETDPNLSSASPKAVACATRAYTKLRAFIASKPEKLRRVAELGKDKNYTTKFYLWTNDYTRAKEPFPEGVRKNRLWFWMRKPQVAGKTPGYWKWESTLTQSGKCLIPEDAQINDYLDEKLRELTLR